MGLKTIGKAAFCNTALRRLEVPATVETIGCAAFVGCEQLESLVLPPTLEVIEFELCCRCKKLKEIEIPTTVKKIGNSAFEECFALQKLDLIHCTQCLTIGSHAFQSCRELSWITLPPNLEGPIQKGTFKSCSSLTHIRVPPNVTYFGDRQEFSPFVGCTSLLSLELPEGLEYAKLVVFDDDADEYGLVEFNEDVLRCPSLVNLYLPEFLGVSNSYWDAAMPQGSQLSKVAGKWGNLVSMLMSRFDGCPLNKICYFHSYHPMEDTIHQVKRLLLADKQNTVMQVDYFGMTPSHILALAQTPRLELFQELVTSVDVAMKAKDRFGSTPLDYLRKNVSEGGLQTTRWLMHKVVGEKGAYLGLGRWKQELLVLEERVILADCMSTMSHEVQSLLDRLARLELLEGLSLMEMVLWRMKLVEDQLYQEIQRQQASSDRESCRVHCGISIVVENVLPFLESTF
ncbi:MAG: hypothetical protein SGBAC_003392 [Bacillariaceae sp.]